MANNEYISLDIGSKNIKIVVGKQQSSNIVVSAAFMFPTPVNSIQDGKIMDLDALVQSIKKSLNDNKLKAKKAILTIESTSIIRREIVLPMVKPDEMEAMVRYEIEQYLPIMLNEYVVEYRILEEFTDEDAKKCKILVAAISKLMVEDYLQLVRALELVPSALDINSNAISKLFASKQTLNGQSYALDKTIALVDYGHNSINFTIVSNGLTKFSRLITLGGSDIDINIANTLNLDTSHAEEKKIKEGKLTSSSEGSTTDAMLSDMIRYSVDRANEEIQRMFQYYTSRENTNRIDEILLFGGGANLNGLDEYLKSAFNIPVYKISSLSSFKYSKQDSLQLEYFLNAAGAIIRR